MTEFSLQLADDEAKALYRLLHRLPDGQDRFCQVYLQLQNHFFKILTVEEVTVLLEGKD